MSSIMVLTVIGALLMVLAAVLVTARGVGFFWGGRRRAPEVGLDVLSRAALAPKQGVAVLDVAGDRILVSYGEGGVRMLHHLDGGRRAADRVVLPDSLDSSSRLGEESDPPNDPAPGLTASGRRRIAGIGMLLLLCGAGPISGQDTTVPPPAPAADAAQAAGAAGADSGSLQLNQSADVEPLGPGVLWDLMRAAGVSGEEDGEGLLPGPVGAVLFVGFLTLLPTLLLLMTSFTRILVVLNLLRQAVGTQTAPPTHLLIALSLLLTGFVMSPTLEEVNQVALRPWVDGEIDEVQMLAAGSGPFRTFMLSQVREQDLAVFAEMQSPVPGSLDDVSLPVLTSAFVTSELRRAFQIGFALFLPFVVIDVVVASVLMSMGMFMLPPVMVSLPFKLLLFVMVDGWALMLGGLVRSFGA
ncbi:MAG: flagellar type III secretion system pore protein FliP [Gemmatimonadetes bacterium]|nr:flagellar type III secretion system pore protein FliP [Gemmatimonadota bacterium]